MDVYGPGNIGKVKLNALNKTKKTKHAQTNLFYLPGLLIILFSPDENPRVK